jgi:hypothetical protein
VEVDNDLLLDPYYGDKDQAEALYSSLAKHETATFHAYAILYARDHNKRYTLTVRKRPTGETPSNALNYFFELRDGLDLRVKAVYLHRGFYNRPV